MVKNKNNKKINTVKRAPSRTINIKTCQNSESDESNRVFLIALIIFVAVSVAAIFVIKLADYGYLGKKQVVIENSEIIKTEKSNVSNMENETKDVQGYIESINKDGKSISVKGRDLVENKEVTLDFLVADSTEIILSGNQEKISLSDLLVLDSVIVNATGNKEGDWIAGKIEVMETNFLGAKVLNIEKNKLIVFRDLGDLGPSITYGVIISSATKIIIKDYSKAIQAESNNFDVTKVVESKGTISDIKNDSFVIVYAKDGNIPRKGEDFEAAKIEIILNQ